METYSEQLKSGGTLCVCGSDGISPWYIEYLFCGPDRRFNGQWAYIYPSNIDLYISAFRTNFAKFTLLKKSLPSGGQITKTGDMHMYIYVGTYNEGVTLKFNKYHNYAFPIRTERQLEQIISDLEYAKIKAAEILSNYYHEGTFESQMEEIEKNSVENKLKILNDEVESQKAEVNRLKKSLQEKEWQLNKYEDEIRTIKTELETQNKENQKLKDANKSLSIDSNSLIELKNKLKSTELFRNITIVIAIFFFFLYVLK